jgi:hypothetical protein
VTIFVEGQCSERASHKRACWLAADELDNEAGHTDALPRQILEGMLTWILQHPVKSRVGKAIGERSTIRLRHGAALSRQRRKAVRRRPCASLAPFLVHSGAIPIDACQPQPKNHWFWFCRIREAPMLELPLQALRITGEFGRILRINPRVRCCRIAGWPGAERPQIVWRNRQRNHRQWAGVMFAIERRWLGDIEPAWRGMRAEARYH